MQRVGFHWERSITGWAEQNGLRKIAWGKVKEGITDPRDIFGRSQRSSPSRGRNIPETALTVCQVLSTGKKRGERPERQPAGLQEAGPGVKGRYGGGEARLTTRKVRKLGDFLVAKKGWGGLAQT